MNFRASFCTPFNPEIIELGDVSKENIINTFEKIPWSDYLEKMKTVKVEDIYYSPSLEIENKDNKNGLAISAVGEPDNYEFYVFYKRPKKVGIFLGFGQRINEKYTTDIMGQTKENVIDLLNALQRNDFDYLENHIGQ